MKRLAALALLLVGLLPAATADSRQDSWLQDVEPLITDIEKSHLLTLSKEKEIAQFQYIFWLKRDPTPETGINEFRLLYEKRLAETRVKYAAGSQFAQVYLAFGPPDRVTQIDIGTFWEYERGPFYSRLNDRFAVVFNGSAIDRSQTTAAVVDFLDHFRDRVLFQPIYVKEPRGRGYYSLDIKKMEDLLLLTALANPSSVSFPFAHEFFLSKTDTLNTYVTLTVKIPGRPDPGGWLALGRFHNPESGVDYDFKVNLVPFMVQGSDCFYSLGLPLPPADYDTAIGLLKADGLKAAGPVHLLRDRLRVASYNSSRVQIGPVILSDGFLKEPAAQKNSFSPYVVGDIIFKPLLIKELSRRGSLYIYFPIYNPQVNNGTVSLEASFLLLRGQEKFQLSPTTIAQPVASANPVIPSSASFPLSHLGHDGRYILEIEVLDRFSGLKDRTTCQFDLKP